MLYFQVKTNQFLEDREMGNIPLSSEDVAFLKEKGSNKTTTVEIKEAFKEFKSDLDHSKGKKMHEVTINFEQFCMKCDSVFNTNSGILTPPDRDEAYRHLFRAFDKDDVSRTKKTNFILNYVREMTQTFYLQQIFSSYPVGRFD